MASAKPDVPGASAEQLLTLLIRLVQEYLNLPLERAAESIDNSLAEVGEFVSADRAYLFKYHDNLTRCSNTHEWCAPGISPQIETLQNVDVVHIPEWINAHRQNQEMHIPDVPSLPRDSRLYEILGPQDIKSVLTVPLVKDGELIGFIGFDRVRHHHDYSDAERHILGLFAQLLVNIESRQEAISHIYYERDRAEQANKAKSTFLANMSHEVRTPLHTITGFCELLQQSPLSEQQHEFVDTIGHASNLLLGLVNDVLDLSKIEADKLVLEQQPVSLRQLVTRIYQMFSQQAIARDIQLNVDVELKGQDRVMTDALRLTQVMMNLVNNAIKFTARGSVQMTVTCQAIHRDYADYTIAVRDTGPGLAPAAQERLFEPFEQAAPGSTQPEQGTGLGLTIAQRIVQAMGSRIYVESSLGEGTRFFFNLTLPLARTAQSAPATRQLPVQEVPDFSGCRLLIAEDVQVNQELLKHLLLPTGCQFGFVDNGLDAVALAAAAPYDLIIMDLQMPGMDGFTAARHILAQRPEAVILAFSAAVTEADVDRFKATGMQGYLAKPVRQQHFYATLQKYLGTCD